MDNDQGWSHDLEINWMRMGWRTAWGGSRRNATVKIGPKVKIMTSAWRKVFTAFPRCVSLVTWHVGACRYTKKAIFAKKMCSFIHCKYVVYYCSMLDLNSKAFFTRNTQVNVLFHVAFHSFLCFPDAFPHDLSLLLRCRRANLQVSPARSLRTSPTSAHPRTSLGPNPGLC